MIKSSYSSCTGQQINGKPHGIRLNSFGIPIKSNVINAIINGPPINLYKNSGRIMKPSDM